MEILHLTLKKQWFDLVSCKKKMEEYRELKPYWSVRLQKSYDAVMFRNGYAKDAPRYLCRLLKVGVGMGRKEWGAPDHKVYILILGEELKYEQR